MIQTSSNIVQCGEQTNIDASKFLCFYAPELVPPITLGGTVQLSERLRQKVEQLINESVQTVLSMLEEPDKERGAYVRLFSLNETMLTPLWEGWVGGESNREREEKYRTISMEKATRLAAEHDVRGHTSSWESRDPENEMWGGAILTEGTLYDMSRWSQFIFSVSGLPEVGDEAAMLLLAVKMCNEDLFSSRTAYNDLLEFPYRSKNELAFNALATTY